MHISAVRNAVAVKYTAAEAGGDRPKRPTRRSLLHGLMYGSVRHLGLRAQCITS